MRALKYKVSFCFRTTTTGRTERTNNNRLTDGRTLNYEKYFRQWQEKHYLCDNKELTREQIDKLTKGQIDGEDKKIPRSLVNPSTRPLNKTNKD